MADRRETISRLQERDDSQMLCENCHTKIEGVSILQDGQISHFGCIDHAREWEKYMGSREPALAHTTSTLRPARRSRHSLDITSSMFRSARNGRRPCLLSTRPLLPSLNAIVTAGPCPLASRGLATTIACHRQAPRTSHAVNTHVRAVLMSGCQHDLLIPSSHALRIADLRTIIATATARTRTHIVLLRGTHILRGHWRIDDVFENPTIVEVSVVVSHARIPLEDVMAPTSPENDYISDIHAKLRNDEVKYLIPSDSMSWQADVTKKMRAILVDWLVAVQRKYKLRDAALYMAVHLLDRYLQVKQTPRNKLQLIGVTCFSIAAKFDQQYEVPRNEDWTYVTDGAYTEQEIIACECAVLNALDFDVTRPSVAIFLDIYNEIDKRSDGHCHLAHYVLQLSLVHGPMLFDQASSYAPSRLAASSILLSNKIEKRNPAWNENMAMYTGYSYAELKKCAKDLCRVLELTEKGSLQAVQKKFSQEQYGCVSKLKPWASAP